MGEEEGDNFIEEGEGKKVEEKGDKEGEKEEEMEEEGEEEAGKCL